MPRIPGNADVVIGMRRSGKTYALFQEMQRLLAEGVPRDRLLYMNPPAPASCARWTRR